MESQSIPGQEQYRQKLSGCREFGMFKELRERKYSLGEQHGHDNEELGGKIKTQFLTKSSKPLLRIFFLVYSDYNGKLLHN